MSGLKYMLVLSVSLSALSSLFIVLIVFTSGVFALKNVTVNIPVAAKIGDIVTLRCNYDIENDTLYAVKWYKSGKEFYRFIPKDYPPSKVFPVADVNVDVTKSDGNEVVLRDVQEKTSGKYRCEISADAPTFHTIRVKGYMNVIELPKGDVNVTTEKKRYANGDILRANCSSPPSSPATNLTWFLNGVKHNSSYLIRYPESNSHVLSHSPSSISSQIAISDHGQITAKFVTIVGIELNVKSTMFLNGKLRLKCVSSLFDQFKTESESVIDEERPRLASVLGSRDSSIAFRLQYYLLMVTILLQVMR